MNKTLKRTMVLGFALVMVLALSAIPAYAVTNYTAVNGTSTTFQKALVMDGDANIPDIDFEFSIAPGAAVPGSTTVFPVMAGGSNGSSGTPVIKDAGGNGTAATPGKAEFAPTDSTVTTATGVTIASGDKAAVKTMTIDFSGVSFTEPGIYRWVLTETSTGQQGITYDTQASTPGSKVRYLDVYVTDNNGSLNVSSYVLHENASSPARGDDSGSGDVATALAAVADKSVGFVNEYGTTNLTFSKHVVGNQASRDKYFKFTVTISNAVAGTKYDVDLSGADPSIAANPNVATTCIGSAVTQPTQLEVAAGETSVSQDFYLAHGQSITIKGLAAGSTYTIEEDNEDYKATYTVDGGSSTTGNTATGTIGSTSPSIDFSNTRGGMVPTGIVASAIPGILFAVCGIGTIVVVKKRSKEKE